MKRIKLSKLSSGFTVAELLIVVVVIGILASVTFVGYKGMATRSINTQLASDAVQSADQLEVDFINSKMYPASAATAAGGSGLKSTSGTNLTYVASADRLQYCLQTSSTKPGTKNYRVLSEGKLTEGSCNGWTGSGGGGGGGGGSYVGSPPAYITACAIPSGGYNIGWPTSAGAVQSHVYIDDGYDVIDEVLDEYNSSWYVLDLGQGGGGGSVTASVEYIDSNGYYSDVTTDTVSFGSADCYS